MGKETDKICAFYFPNNLSRNLKQLYNLEFSAFILDNALVKEPSGAMLFGINVQQKSLNQVRQLQILSAAYLTPFYKASIFLGLHSAIQTGLKLCCVYKL